MRLIDAEALVKEFSTRAVSARNWKENALNNGDEEIVIRADATLAFLTEVKLTIDNAPTVEERPQGEWIEKVERRGCFAGDKTVYSYTCPFCGVKEFKKYPFCHCGADMRGGRE